MIIGLKTDPHGKYAATEIADGITLEQLADEYGKDAPYPFMLARVDQTYTDLREKVSAETLVELLDNRTQASDYVYQDSLFLLLIAAVKNTAGNIPVDIVNSLNQGMYIELRGMNGIPDDVIDGVRQEMLRLVKEDAPFRKRRMPRDEAVRLLEEDGTVPNTVEILQAVPAEEAVPMYEIGGQWIHAYTIIAPSAARLACFELHGYRRGMLLRYPSTILPGEIPAYRDQVKLYGAFEEQTAWDALTGVEFVPDLNRAVDEGRISDLIQLSEALQEKKIAEIADRIVQRRKRIILISGPSSSGKTTFAHRLIVQLRVNGVEPLYLGTDDYFVERSQTPLDENGEPDYEGFNALDVDLFNRNMNDLLDGKTVDLPTFDFLNGRKEFGKRMTSIRPDQPIVIEGIHGLNRKLTEKIRDDEKYKIYISPLTQLNLDEHNRIPTTDERLLRRMVRDYLYRGHDASSTIDAWPKVRAGEDHNIFPFSGEADELFNSYHVYEISVLKKYADPLLREIPKDDPSYAEAQRMLGLLRYFREIDDDSVIVNNSILREFIGGSVFVK